MKWKHFPRYWPFVWGIHWSPVNSPHKGQWRGALMFSLTCAWINSWVNNGEAGDLRRHHAHYDVIVMNKSALVQVMAWHWTGGKSLSEPKMNDDLVSWRIFKLTQTQAFTLLYVYELGSRIQYKMSSCPCRKSHCGDKTVVRSSYLHNGISYTGEMASLYCISPQASMG